MVLEMAVEILKQADNLKEKAAEGVDGTLEMSPVQQQLQKMYHEVLILDLEYALDKKVEQDLWNYCFKNNIVSLQNHAKDKKKNGALIQSRLMWFLDCATGFYVSLLQEICTAFNLDLPFLRLNCLYGLSQTRNETLRSKPNRSSCYYICQYCLVHLGDIARYRNQTIQAKSFYKQALSLGANSGHPYNQLALLEVSRSDLLGTVFYYTRSISVTHKFPVAMTNLSNTLQKCTKFECPVDAGQISVSEYESAFLKLHALLYLNMDVSGANRVLQTLTHSLTPLIATQELSSWKLIQMSVITIFMYSHSEEKPSNGQVRKTLSEFLSGFLTSLLVPLYTISNDLVMDYFGLPSIKVLLSWFQCDPSVLSLMDKPHIWKGLCKLLNSLRSLATPVPAKCLSAALPEDYDLQGFLLLDSVMAHLNFSGEKLEEVLVKRVRAHRIIGFGAYLAEKSEWKPICITETGDFDMAQVLENGTKETAKRPVSHEGGRPRARQNVAMQSLLKKSNLASGDTDKTIGGTEWRSEERRPGEWWPQGDEFMSFVPNVELPCPEGTYSLFNGTNTQAQISKNSVLQPSSSRMNQSLWSGPGPSPLERLLEQQKQLRNGSSHDS